MKQEMSLVFLNYTRRPKFVYNYMASTEQKDGQRRSSSQPTENRKVPLTKLLSSFYPDNWKGTN